MLTIIFAIANKERVECPILLCLLNCWLLFASPLPTAATTRQHSVISVVLLFYSQLARHCVWLFAKCHFQVLTVSTQGCQPFVVIIIIIAVR